MESKRENIDETKYSRQIYVIGKDGMRKLTQTDVIICGLTGEGLELAKCIILAGIRKVSIYHHNDILNYNDLSSNYYATSEMIGNKYIENVITELSSLNNNVNVVMVNELTDLVLMTHNIAVFCGYGKQELIQYNNLCRELNIKFIMVQSYGLSGDIFCDFGENYIINDCDGLPIITGIISKIQESTLYTEEKHGLYTGDIIKFEQNTIIGENKFMVRTLSVTEFKICEYVSIGQPKTALELQREAYCAKQIDIKNFIPHNLKYTRIKIPQYKTFKPISEQFNDPKYVIVDTIEHNIHKVQNAFMNALLLWKDNHTTYDVYNKDDYNTIKESFECIYKQINGDDQITDDILNKFNLLFYSSHGNICGMNAVVGSIGGHEVIKAATQITVPIDGFLHYTAIDILPDNYLELRMQNPNEYRPQNSRYDGQYVIFGKSFIDRIQEKKLFIVGAGAIGCELIKNLAMMGVGNITITDMDHIEKSNLSRQFLFRPTDIGQPKSIVAANKGNNMNPDINIISHTNRLDQNTSNIYNSKFFEQIDCVLNALDNIPARKFVDNLCVQYGKPLIDSGTLGTQGSIQVIVPNLTESYGSSDELPTEDIPMCTLKRFPFKFEHLVQFSRELFEGYFNNIPLNFLKVSNDISVLNEMVPSEVVSVYKDVSLIVNNSRNFKNCISLAYKEWHKIYRDTILKLIRKYPIEHINDDRLKFWSGNKIFPLSLSFDTDNKTHMEFIYSFANIWADVLNITKRYPITKIDKYKQFINKLPLPDEDVTIDIDGNNINNYDIKNCIQAITNMVNNNKDRLNINVIEFEKDDDNNNHIEFITSASNLRGSNYRIKSQDKLSVKGIVGKIVPAISTTTSIVSGLVALEFYKLCYGQEMKEYNTIQRYRFGGFNLAIPMFCFSESNAANIKMIGEDRYSIWTKKLIDHKQLFEDFIDDFNECYLNLSENDNIYDLQVEFVSNDTGILYSRMMNEYDTGNNNMNRTVGDVIKDSLNIDVLDGEYFLTVCLEKANNDISINNDDGINIVCKIIV